MLKSESLPHDYATRWGAVRKAQVVQAVNSGLLRLDDALARYRLSIEEFQNWQRALALKGIDGLRATDTRARTFGRKGLQRMMDRAKVEHRVVLHPV